MLEQADIGITAQAMESSNNRYAGDENLLVQFYLHPRHNQGKSEEAGRPIFVDTEYIRIMQPGNKDSIIERPATQMDKTRFAEHYRKYQARESQEAVEGTRLEDWPGVTRSQVEELKYMNVLTVEQLVAMSDSNAQSFTGIGAIRQKAEKYLEASKDSAATEKLDSMQARIAELEAQLHGDGAIDEAEAPQVAETAPEKDTETPVLAEKPKRRRRTAA